MAKDTTPDIDSAPIVASEPTEFAQMLSDFCTHLSASDKRVESIGAFHSTEKAAGRLKDLPSAYAARYAVFLNKSL